jgi:TPP-dependent pyruvate/acetoin dehydrogenase alpha subunit
MALAERERGSGAVTVAFVGDGTLGQGVLYESLNMASLWRLPILFVVENNFYAQSTPSRRGVAGRISARGEAFGIETTELDTTDVRVIEGAAADVVERVRSAQRPFFLVLDTYRFSPHSKGDDFRDPAEVEAARTRDPLAVAAEGIDVRERRAVEESCERRLADAISEAEASPPAVPG